ncbi:MAG: hypothetical protein OQL19_00410 [Gammaproteobacteria bacterium]|nr:hypothetical protein [Gammaproteobacteria bacterium]
MKKKYIILSGFAILVIVIVFFARITYDHKIEKLVQSQIRKVVAIFPWIKISYQSLETKSNGDVILRNLKIDNSKSGRFVIAKNMTFHRFDRFHSVPQYLDLTIEQLQLSLLPPDNLKENFIGFTQLGAENLLLSMSIAYEYDDFTHTIQFSSSIDVDNIAQASLNLNFANVDYDQLRYYRSSMNDILFIGGEALYVEKGILPKFITYKAKQMQLTEKQLLIHMSDKLDNSSQQAINNKQPNISRFYQSGKLFLQQQKTLKLSAYNRQGISFKRLKELLKSNSDREKLASILNVQLTAQ